MQSRRTLTLTLSLLERERGTFGGSVSVSPNRDPRRVRSSSPLPARSGERIKVRGASDCILTAKPERCSCRWGARSSRPLPSASRRRAGGDRVGAPFGEWNLPPHLFGETPNRSTGTVALPFSDCIVPAQAAKRGVLFGGNHVRDYYSRNRFGRTYPRDHDRRQFKQGVRTPNHGRFDGGG